MGKGAVRRQRREDEATLFQLWQDLSKNDLYECLLEANQRAKEFEGQRTYADALRTIQIQVARERLGNQPNNTESTPAEAPQTPPKPMLPMLDTTVTPDTTKLSSCSVGHASSPTSDSSECHVGVGHSTTTSSSSSSSFSSSSSSLTSWTVASPVVPGLLLAFDTPPADFEYGSLFGEPHNHHHNTFVLPTFPTESAGNGIRDVHNNPPYECFPAEPAGSLYDLYYAGECHPVQSVEQLLL